MDHISTKPKRIHRYRSGLESWGQALRSGLKVGSEQPSITDKLSFKKIIWLLSIQL